MNELPVAYNNTYLFNNKGYHVKLVDFYLQENKLDEAMRTARLFNNNLKIAEIYELKKDYARAAKYYEKVKNTKKTSNTYLKNDLFE